MPKFRKLPVVIDAVRWNGATIGMTNGGRPMYSEDADVPPSPVKEQERLELPPWLPSAKVFPPDWSEAAVKAATQVGEVSRYLDFLHIGTTEGVMSAAPGDWIIRGVKGELYPCKPDIFAATYELAE